MQAAAPKPAWASGTCKRVALCPAFTTGFTTKPPRQLDYRCAGFIFAGIKTNHLPPGSMSRLWWTGFSGKILICEMPCDSRGGFSFAVGAVLQGNRLQTRAWYERHHSLIQLCSVVLLISVNDLRWHHLSAWIFASCAHYFCFLHPFQRRTVVSSTD